MYVGRRYAHFSSARIEFIYLVSMMGNTLIDRQEVKMLYYGQPVSVYSLHAKEKNMPTFANNHASWLVRGTLLIVILTLSGCDTRGPNERNVDKAITQVEHDPNMSQAGKDATIIFYDGLKAQAKETDKQIAALSPEQRDAAARMQRLEAGIEAADQKDKEIYRLPAYQEPSLSLGMNYAPLNRGNARRTGINFGTGIFVESVTPNTTAAQAGMQRGDIIDAADGYLLNGTFNVGDALHQHANGNPLQGQPVRFHLFRDGQWYSMEVYPMSR